MAAGMPAMSSTSTRSAIALGKVQYDHLRSWQVLTSAPLARVALTRDFVRQSQAQTSTTNAVLAREWLGH